MEESQGDLFVLPPETGLSRGDRPPPGISVLRLTGLVVVTILVMVAVTWLLGLAVKAVLDGYFASG